MAFTKERDDYLEVIEVLNKKVWDRRLKGGELDLWLAKFSAEEQLSALHLLAQFTYFGHREIREMLRTLYRDMIRYPAIQSIRKVHGNTLDPAIIEPAFEAELRTTRFLGMGNPSESGTHLLYYFRQENDLPKSLFINGHEIFHRDAHTHTITLKTPKVRRYVFIDDLCGSGSQAIRYSKNLLRDMLALDNTLDISYFSLLGSEAGLNLIRKQSAFTTAEALFSMDESFRCFHPSSRYYLGSEQAERVQAESTMRKHGMLLEPSFPLGFNDSQLLLGFFHNIPDNTLPVIWSTKSDWTPVFRRYDKKYK